MGMLSRAAWGNKHDTEWETAPRGYRRSCNLPHGPVCFASQKRADGTGWLSEAERGACRVRTHTGGERWDLGSWMCSQSYRATANTSLEPNTSQGWMQCEDCLVCGSAKLRHLQLNSTGALEAQDMLPGTEHSGSQAPDISFGTLQTLGLKSLHFRHKWGTLPHLSIQIMSKRDCLWDYQVLWYLICSKIWVTPV